MGNSLVIRGIHEKGVVLVEERERENDSLWLRGVGHVGSVNSLETTTVLEGHNQP